MRPKSLILILIALGCGLVASIGISQVVERRGETEEVQTTPIYVAMADMRIGEELGPTTIKIEEWPNDRIPEGAIRDAEKLEGLVPKQPLYEGEPLLMAKLAKKGSLQAVANRIKVGHRVVAVKVTRESAVAGLIFPGDHVDVMSFVRGSSRDEGPRAQTILADIEVFAINDRIDRIMDDEGNSIDAKTVSLLVKPEQAKQLMLYANLGPLNLSLRRPDDPDAVEPTVDLAPPPPIVVADSGPAPVVEEDHFVMEIIEGGQAAARRFRFDEDGTAPTEIVAGPANPADIANVDGGNSEPPFPIGEPGSNLDDDPRPRPGSTPNQQPSEAGSKHKIDWSFLSE